jgi:hypothetical protein
MMTVEVAAQITQEILTEDPIIAEPLMHNREGRAYVTALVELTLILGHRAAKAGIPEIEIAEVVTGCAMGLLQYRLSLHEGH